ncbi:hypothetical protein MQE23_22195 [Streptomyces sp. HP-A2021]|uniref:hypothetical protein n=1 Tax=Streptomyces sp. HP-A2021 TaxID=2927875 RepID=UPI001FB00F06|nr:hypothetical protein [Streptomyces sp. HP-A2021]UOB11617.1 hypothetical protein MQE23_22195 [Streptomyces sp. HP-A2021]
MAEPDPQQHAQQLAELDVSTDLFTLVLSLALEDVRGCTDFDAPAARGFLFWSRANRYLAEVLVPDGWGRTSRDSILRVIHPNRTHAITAISAEGGVADLNRRVRSKNPKGPAMARMVEKNGQLAFLSRDEVEYGVELDQLPTWCLLYKREEGIMQAELSLPVKMNGKFVDEWLTRIPISLPPMDDPGFDISLDEPGDDQGPEVVVELLGEN